MFIRALILLLLIAPVAEAQDSPAKVPVAPAEKSVTADDGREEASTIRVYQQRPLMKAGRLELGGLGGISMNDQAFVHVSSGISTHYHITEAWGIGASYNKYYRMRTGLEDVLTQEFGVFPERKFRDFYAGGEVTWSPIYGKMLVVESGIVHFDLYFVGGAGAMRTFTQGAEGDIRVSGNVGFGSRFALGSWAAITTQVRDYMYMETLQAGDFFFQDWVFHLGLSFFAPFEYDYRYPK